MAGVLDWVKRQGAFVWRNADAFFAMAVAVGVLVAEAVGTPSQGVVNSAVLALLGTTAFALMRNRNGRGELDELRMLAKDAIGDRPYEVVSQDNHWDLTSRERTTMRVTEQLRFTRNDVSTIANWSTGDGKVVRYQAKWRRPGGERWIDAELIHRFPIRNGEKVIYSLDEEHCRGDMLDWLVEREAIGRFPTAHESVTLEARTSSDHPRVLRITWPAETDPSNVEIRFRGLPARPLHTKRSEGRTFVEERIAGMAVGESVEIAWTW